MHRFRKQKTFGKLFVWGQNSSGQLGQGDVVLRSSPTQVGTLTTWTHASAYGTAHIAAIQSDGTLWTWGTGGSGELGHGDTVSRSSPTQVGTLTTWVHTVTGGSSTLALKSDGTLWGWGANTFGRLGFGDAVARSSPAQVGTLTSWTHEFGVKSAQSNFMRSGGTLWATGQNFYAFGAIGDGTIVAKSSPIQIGSLTTWVAVSCGGSYGSSALKSDGTLWAWGGNTSGRLGQNNTVTTSSPVQVGTLKSWVDVSDGVGYTAARKADGTLWMWGNNGSGSLGLGDVIKRSSPTQVGSLTSWTKVSAGQVTFAIQSDGTLWTWGNNTYGRLGLGDTVNRSSPTQIGTDTSWVDIGDENTTVGVALKR